MILKFLPSSPLPPSPCRPLRAAIARRFGIASSETCRTFLAVYKAVVDNMGLLFELRTGSERVVVGFGLSSLHNFFRVLGVSRFRIDDSFLGENGCLMVEALVDSEGRFLDVSAVWPSTMNPETILWESMIYLEVEESKELLNGPCYLIPQNIMGESCFSLFAMAFVAYNRVNEKDSFGSMERAFNCAHGNAMELIGNAFWGLRARWQLFATSRK